MTSCSSAYSSCESSAFSPFGPGSVTELSDIGSCDTGMEYDHPPHRHHHSRVSESIVVGSVTRLLMFQIQRFSDFLKAKKELFQKVCSILNGP